MIWLGENITVFQMQDLERVLWELMLFIFLLYSLWYFGVWLNLYIHSCLHTHTYLIIHTCQISLSFQRKTKQKYHPKLNFLRNRILSSESLINPLFLGNTYLWIDDSPSQHRVKTSFLPGTDMMRERRSLCHDSRSGPENGLWTWQFIANGSSLSEVRFPVSAE